MAPEELRDARQPFYQGFGSTGIGLGLEIAVLGAAVHHGQLILDSTPGEGTRAGILLPQQLVNGGPRGD